MDAGRVGALYSTIFLPSYATQGYGATIPFISLNFYKDYACRECELYANGGIDRIFNKSEKYSNENNLGTFDMYCAGRAACYQMIVNFTKNELIGNVNITTRSNYDKSDASPEEAIFARTILSIDYISNVLLDCRSYSGCGRLTVDTAIDANITALCAAEGTLSSF